MLGDQLEADYPFTTTDVCTGLYKKETVASCRYKDISYNNAEADIEETFTISAAYTAETDDDEFDIEYRGLLTVQTYNRGEVYLAAAAVYPERMDDAGWFGDYSFNEDFVSDSRSFMKNAR